MKWKKSGRFFSVLLAFALLASLVPAASASHKPDWETWSQGGSDAAYRSTRNDGSLAFRAFGCHFMAHCKLMAEAGVVDARTFNPDDYFSWVVSNGYTYGRQANGTYAIGETNVGQSMIHYAKARGVSISRAATVSLRNRTPEQKKALLQQYIQEGYYIILHCAAHETYIMREESLKRGTPWISDSSGNYASVSRSSGIYAYTGVYKGGGGWEAAFDTAYLYSVNASGSGSFTAPPEPTVGSGTSISTSLVTTGADTITETSAILRGSVSSTGAKMTRCGMRLGESAQSMTVLGYDDISTNRTTCFYSTEKYGRPLKPGTTYYYQVYAVVNGKEYTGNVKSFTTVPDTTPKPSVSISLSQDSLTMPENTSKTLSAVTTPGGLAVSWRSSDPTVAAVDNGSITARKAGTTTITASVSSNGQIAFALCQVTVTASQTACTSHVKGSYLWYAEVHPHYDHYLCAVCGEKFRDTTTNNMPSCKICNPDPQPCTTHVKGEYLWYEEAHPHYNCYLCAVCGERFRDTTTSNMPSCEICNPKTAAVTVTTQPASNITSTSARLNGSISVLNVGRATITESGMYLGTSASVQTLLYKNTGSSTVTASWAFADTSDYITLKPNTTYYYYYYVVVDGKTVNGSLVSFRTLP